MESSQTETLLTQIGQLLAEDQEYPLDCTLLYAVVGRNSVRPSIFKDMGNSIIYRSPDLDRLGGVLLDLWEAQGEGEKWEEVHYLVKNGRFEASFVYPDQLDPDAEWLERRDDVVKQYFGEKPVSYPDWDDEDSFVY